MTTRAWIGGGNNSAANPNDWSPTGAPRPGDTLSMTSGTMNIFGYAIAGDILTVSGNVDLNLFNAFANIDAGIPALDPPVTSAVINLSGFDEMTYTGFATHGTINLEAGAVWEGTFNLNSDAGPHTHPPGATLTINGGVGSFFVNDGTDISGDSTTINANVVGTGGFGFALDGTLEFVHSVAAGQSVNFNSGSGSGSGVLQLDDPTQFAGLITLQPSAGPGFVGPDLIKLENLATADSYTYKNDMLSIFSNNQVIDTLRLINQSVTQSGSPSPIELEKTGSVVYVFGASDGNLGLNGTVLPVHS